MRGLVVYHSLYSGFVVNRRHDRCGEKGDGSTKFSNCCWERLAASPLLKSGSVNKGLCCVTFLSVAVHFPISHHCVRTAAIDGLINAALIFFEADPVPTGSGNAVLATLIYYFDQTIDDS